MSDLSTIEGLLFDLDGTLYVGSHVLDGAIEAIAELKRLGYRRRFITNTSTLSRASLQQKLNKLGFAIEAHEIISAPSAALIYLQQFDDPVCHLLMSDDVKQDFQAFKQSDSDANFVIIGDIGSAWSYDILNNAFRLLNNGAQLIAIHKNRYWQTERGLQMDIGGFVQALEYASQKKATIIGKPSPDFFQSALKDINLPSQLVAIIGDDIDSDVGGGQNTGLTGILVKTGKYRREHAENSSIHPDLTLASIAELPSAITSTKNL